MSHLDQVIRSVLPGTLEEEYMGLEQYWEERGLEKGRLQGQRDAVLRLHQSGSGHTLKHISDWL